MLSFRIAWTGLLAAATSQHCRTSCDRRAPGACHVQVGDQCYGCRVYLLLAQDGVLANTPEKPVAEMRRRLDDAAAKKVAPWPRGGQRAGAQVAGALLPASGGRCRRRRAWRD